MPTLNEAGLITLDRKAILKPYQPRSFVEREFLTDAEILANIGGTLFLNVESYPNYFLITFKLHNTNKFLQFEVSNTATFNPKFLSWIMFNYRTVGFNSINYDLIVLWASYREQYAPFLKDITNDLIINNKRDWEVKKEYGFQTFNTNHIDLIEVAPLKGSLKLYGARIHTESIQDQPFDIDKDLNEFFDDYGRLGVIYISRNKQKVIIKDNYFTKNIGTHGGAITINSPNWALG